MNDKMLFPEDKTTSRQGPLPPLSDPVWDVVDATRDESLAMAALSLRHAAEMLRVVMSYHDLRVRDNEVARRVRRAFNLIEDALAVIG